MSKYQNPGEKIMIISRVFATATVIISGVITILGSASNTQAVKPSASPIFQDVVAGNCMITSPNIMPQVSEIELKCQSFKTKKTFDSPDSVYLQCMKFRPTNNVKRSVKLKAELSRSEFLPDYEHLALPTNTLKGRLNHAIGQVSGKTHVVYQFDNGPKHKGSWHVTHAGDTAYGPNTDKSENFLAFMDGLRNSSILKYQAGSNQHSVNLEGASSLIDEFIKRCESL